MPEDELLCVACDHPEGKHTADFYGGNSKPGGHCTHKLSGGDHPRICTCSAFVRPSPRQQQSTNYKRPRFTQQSGRTEIGTGASSRTANIQDSVLVHLPGQKQGPIEAVPEWVMFGVKEPDGTVKVYASTKLSYVTMRQEAPGEFERIHADMIASGKLEDKPWSLRGRMVGYIVSHSRNYVDALRDLMSRGWIPDSEPSTADLQRRAALEDLRVEDEFPPAPVVAEPDDDGIYEAEIVDE